MKNEVREIAPADLHLIRPLFRQVFKTDITDAMLDWKYGEGLGRAYGYFNDAGELLVHCGLSYRRVLADGQPRRIAHMGDLMAASGRHGGLGRASAFAHVIRRMLDDIPDEHNPDGLAFGFPSDRAMRLGEQMGLFASIDQMRQLTFGPLPRRWSADRLVMVTTPDSSFCKLADQLWQGMAEELGEGLVVIRDADYLAFRYFSHPSLRYACHLVKPWWGGQALGIVITRCEGRQCELVDLIAPPAAVGRLIKAVRQHLAGWGVDALTLWLTERHAAAVEGQAQSNDRLELRIMANPFSSGGQPERFANRWWLTSGDTDYH